MKSSFFLLTALCVVFTCFSANAQISDTPSQVASNSADAMEESGIPTDIAMLKKTHPEQVVFAQMKLSKEAPDFDELAKKSPNYLNALDIDKPATQIAEYNRMSNFYNLYNENRELVMHTKLRVDNYSSLQNLLVFDELDEQTFFRVSMYDYNVGIVPENIERFNKILIAPSRAKTMFDDLAGKKFVIAEFVLKPIYADKKEPFITENSTFWLMFARIGEVRLWTDTPNPILVWFYRAPWYVPTTDETLDDLFNE